MMMPGMNQRKMQQMMKKMGVSQQEMPAKEVIIRTEDTEYVFMSPQVSKVNMMGQETYQVVGTPEERSLDKNPEINDDDVSTVMEQTGVDEKTARSAIEKADGDLANAIMQLSQQDGS